jgi:hypothetical protein
MVTHNTTRTSTAIADSGCTGHFLQVDSPCLNKTPTSNGLRVLLPDGSTIQATHTALLDMPDLPIAARQGHIFPQLKHNALISISQFCDHGCTALFTSTDVQILVNSTTIICGSRQPATGLWTIDLDNQPKSPSSHERILGHAANSVYEMETKFDLVAYLHRCCYSPTTSGWLKAIKTGFFTTWPGLDETIVQKHLPKSAATIKGHQRQQFKNLRSTSLAREKENSDEPLRTASTNARIDRKPHEFKNPDELHITASDAARLNTKPDKFQRILQDNSEKIRINMIYVKAIEATGQIYTDQTGRFPTTSSRGNKYVMILYDYDSNAILAEPLKSKSEGEMIRAYTKLHEYLTDRGLKPRLQKLDNECPAGLKRFMTQNEVDFQLVPPHIHRRNSAERAISSWKDHFIAGLSSTDKQFPMHLWCRLITQCTLTLNLLCQSRINPRLSSEAQLNGAFDFNRTPLAPPGTRVIIHEQTGVRRTWSVHGTDGWYLGPAPEHYRCYTVYCSKTGNERIIDTVEFFPADIRMPRMSSADNATIAAKELTNALLNPAPAAPFATIGNDQLVALKQLALIFQQATTKDNPTSQIPSPSPRVSEPASSAATQLPRVPATPHRYNTRSSALLNQAIALPKIQCFPTQHRANSVIDQITGQSYEYRHLVTGKVTGHTTEVWTKSFANELGRLANGVGTRVPEGTNTIFFINRSQVPTDRKVTYGRIVCTIRPQKKETHRTRLTVGGNLIDYP